MQTMLKVFDIGSMGNMADVNAQKIAIRMNSKDGSISDGDEAGFMESLKKFLSTADDQEVKSSLEELDWISLEGEGGLTPVIDFTDGLENISSLEALVKSFFDVGADQIDAEQILSASGSQLVAPENEGLADDIFPEADSDTEIVNQLAAAARNASSDVLKTEMMGQFRKSAEGAVQECDEDAMPTAFNKLIQTQSNPQEAGEDVPAKNETSAFAEIKPTTDEKSRPVQDEASSKRDLNDLFSGVQKSTEETSEDELSVKSGEASTSRKPVGNLQTGQSTQQFQMMDKEKEAAQQAQRTEKQDTPAFQRMFADNASSNQDQSATFQSDTSNGGNPDPQSNLLREGQPGTEAQLHSIDSKSADSAQSAESSNTQPAQKTMEDDLIRQIVQRMTLRNTGDQSRMTIQLKPEFLGNLKLEITTENQHVAIKMTAESSAVKEMIEHNISVLKTELQQHKLNVEKIDVYVGQDNESSEQRQQETASWQESQANTRRIKSIKTRESQDDLLMETADENTAAIRKTRSGEIDFFA